MALQLWFPDVDYNFPGLLPFVRFVNYIDPARWASDLYHAVGRYFWQSVEREASRQIGDLSRDLALRTTQTVGETLARYFENARWAVTNLPSLNLYSGLETYYSKLSPLNPIRARQLARNLGEEEPYRYDRYDGAQSNQKSAEYVEKYDSPGGAHQRHTPDWMLPLILGLYGDISPSWGETIKEIEEEEDGPKKKRPRKAGWKASRSTKANH
ncbi:VP3 minor capsid protein [Betapolyomavirus mastomysis]|nr:VP3 minor capsid protein [Betapolyomavirus mastomysis]BAJ53085.1 VP3 minor capsid protein [Betapolyomavirus mastomysis]